MTPLLPARRPAADRAFERLYRNHVHGVYRYALAVLHNEADAEDVTQTTFLNAYRAFQRGERPHTPHNWLIKIAHNVCRQRFRDSSRRPREVEFDDAHAPAAIENADVPSADEIRRALGFLAFNQRAALVMRELEGRSYAEIAQVLDLSVSAVETLMFRARRALREQLEGGLTCDEAEQTLASLEKGRLSSAERGALRAHLRECKDCATLERRQRAQRAALEHLGTVPLPASLATFLGGGAGGGAAAAGGIGIAAKVATVLAAGLVVTAAGHETLKARATNAQTPKAKRTTVRPNHSTAGPASTSANPLHRSQRTKTRGQQAGSNPAHTRSRQAARASASGPGAAEPGAQPSPGASSGAGEQSAGGPPATPPPPPPIQLPQLPVQVPPVQLPPVPPVQLPPVPPVTLPPPPPLPPLPPVPPLPPPPLPPPPPIPPPPLDH
jgi:RNA polymerase sigma factor (sigma-70 family)